MASPTAAMFYFYKSSCSQALETPLLGFRELNGRKSCWTDLPLHQSLPDLLRNLLRNPIEPDPALHQSLPDLIRNLLRNLFERDLALHQSLPDLLWNLRNLLRNEVLSRRLHQCTPQLFWAEDPISLRCWGGKKNIEPLEHIVLSGGR